MTRLTNLSIGVGTTLILSFGLLLWTPSTVGAAPGGPQDGYVEKSDCSAIHKIAVGENLTVIAASYGIPLEALVEANGITDANLIVEGQALCVPGVEGGNGYGRPENGYGESENGNGQQSEEWSRKPYMVPGKSYDPSYYENGNNGNSQQGPQEGGYNNESYGPQEQGYGEDDYERNGYGKPENGHGEEGYSTQEYRGIPGKSYDPALVYPKQHEPREEPNADLDPSDFDEPIETPTPPPPDDMEEEEEEENGDGGDGG